MHGRRFALTAAMILLSTPALAKELEGIGRAAVPIGSRDPASIRATAAREAKRLAVLDCIDKVLGPGSSKDPRVVEKLPALLDHVGDERVVESKSERVGDDFALRIKLVLDDKEFRTLLADQGVALNTAAVRSYSLLAVMDEFLTTPRDLKAPLEELEEFHREVGQSFRDKESSHSANHSASAKAASSAVAVDSREHQTAKASGSHDSRIAAHDEEGSASGRSKGSFSGEAASARELKGVAASSSASVRSTSSSARASLDVAAEQHDNVSWKKVVKYQPQGVPEKSSQTYNALASQLQDYDLRLLDNDLFRSKYFQRPVTLDQLQESGELAKYVAFAKKDANADFFMVGTAVIIDAGANAHTGETQCTGVASLKTYSTLGGESIASETVSETATGRNVNDCAAALGKKLAAVTGPIIGAKVQDYWKKRATYGQEYVLKLKGANLPLLVRGAFAKALKSVPGVASDRQRAASAQEVEMVVTYKGSDPLDQAVAAALEHDPRFVGLDSQTDGSRVTLCMGPCAAPAVPVKGKKR